MSKHIRSGLLSQGSHFFSKDVKVVEYADVQMETKVSYTSEEALKGFEFVNELAKTCPKGFLEGRGAENFGTENNNIAMWYSQNLVQTFQKTESLGLTDIVQNRSCRCRNRNTCWYQLRIIRFVCSPVRILQQKII